MHNSSDLIAILSRGRRRCRPSRVRSKPVFGADWEAAQGTPLLDHVHPEDRRSSRVPARGGRQVTGRPHEGEWRLRYPDGTCRHLAGVATNLIDDARVEGLVVTARDVDERKAFEEQLRHRAFHDALTGLANRALFYDRIEHALRRGARADGQAACCSSTSTT